MRKFLNNIPDIINKAITPHLTDNLLHNDIVPKSEEFDSANSAANAEHTKRVYSSMGLSYKNAAKTRSSYLTQQPRPDKRQATQNRVATPGARSTASAGNND